jgi:hypothetical protein
LTATKGIFLDTLSNQYLIPSAVPMPPTPVAPIIPATAKNTGSILAIPGWKMEWDDGTPPTAKNISMIYNPTTKTALFSADQTGKAGVRWSVTAAKNVPDTVMNYCYDITFQLPDPTQEACVELDINHVDSLGNIYFLCVQASHYSKSYEYTLGKAAGGVGWNPSIIPVDPLAWPANTNKHIRIFSHRDNAKKVYYDGVEEDGKYSIFAPTSFGLDTENENWTKQILLPNFQLDGANASGHISALVSNFVIYYW